MKNTCSRSTYVKILLLMMHAKRTMYGVIEKRKLTPVQGTLLVLFEPGQAKSMQGLTCLMGCDASNTTGLVDRLESHGLIERTVDPADRRVKMIQLTAEGIQCREELLDEVRKAEAIDFERLTTEEVHSLSTILDKLTVDVNIR